VNLKYCVLWGKEEVDAAMERNHIETEDAAPYKSTKVDVLRSPLDKENITCPRWPLSREGILPGKILDCGVGSEELQCKKMPSL
jgi:hypothetical protein